MVRLSPAGNGFGHGCRQNRDFVPPARAIGNAAVLLKREQRVVPQTTVAESVVTTSKAPKNRATSRRREGNMGGSSVAPDVRLDGKTAIVTGANAGIGLETARVLYLRGARVLLAVRSTSRGEAARAQI